MKVGDLEKRRRYLGSSNKRTDERKKLCGTGRNELKTEDEKRVTERALERA